MRTKHVFETAQVPHIWARQSQNHGRNSQGNVYFNGSEIYSYGRHFCMAKIISPDVVLITNRSYSNTTSGHLSSVRYAVNHFGTQIYIPFPEKDIASNAQAIINDIQDQLNIIGNTRKRPDTKERAKAHLHSVVSNVTKYMEVTKQKFSKRWVDKDLQRKFNAYFKAAQSEQGTQELADKLQAIERTKRKEETARQKENLKRWLNGEHHVDIWGLNKVYLRRMDLIDGLHVYDTIVQTSKGARVSLKAAKVLFDLIQAGKDIKGHNIDGYTVISINGVLKIGCHEIERAEIERFARTQNWI